MNTRKWVYIVAAVASVVIVSMVVRIQHKDSAPSVRIGVILPLTGQYAFLGESDRKAMLLALEEIEANNGGVNASDIELHFEDDGYDAKTAVSAYQKLRSIDHIDAVVVLSAPSIQSIAPLTNADHIPLLGLGGTVVYEKDSVFQLMPSGNLVFPTLGRLSGEKYKKIAVAHSSAPLFAENTRMFKTGLPADVVADDFIISPSTDHRTEVQKIVSGGPDAVTLFMPKDDAIRFLQALRVQDRGGDVKIICDFGVEIAAREYADAIGKDRLEGCISTNMADTMRADFKTKYAAKYVSTSSVASSSSSSAPAITADYAYDAVGMIADLVTRGVPSSGWIEMLSSRDYVYDGRASGKIRFSDDGTRLDMPPTVRVYRNGVFVPIYDIKK